MSKGHTDESQRTGRLFDDAKARLFSYSYQRVPSHFALLLISTLTLTQVLHAYSIEASTLGTIKVNNCSASSSDFETELKQLADSVNERTEIPSEFLQNYFAGCTIEKARDFLAKHGFATGESAPAFSDKRAGIIRSILAEKMMRRFSQLVSLNCRIILDDKASNGLDIHGFFYFDGP
jgi:hypothetical protein